MDCVTVTNKHWLLLLQTKWGGGMQLFGFIGKGGVDFLGTEIYECQETRRCPIFRHLTVCVGI